MEGDFSLVGSLFLMTFVLALVYGIWTYFRTKRAQRNHEHSASALVNQEAGDAGVRRGQPGSR
jgi:cbb3-type cytochrome oxidase subunit 3